MERPLKNAAMPALQSAARDLRFTGIVVPSASHPRLIELIALWKSKWSDDRPPRRDDLTIRDMKLFMPHILIADPVNGGQDFRVRYCGSSLEQRLGVRIHGRTLREAFLAPAVEEFIQRYREVSETLVPFLRRGRYTGAASEAVDYELGLLPILSSDGEAIWVLGGQFSFERHI